ncbi:hypothetical protein QRO11_03740 [Paracidovorax citrulli]|uniref:DUF7210 family protein n=1 Tax=Paracidovorax citrulli TaxID=80869 RepID=UPI00088DDE74|nr:hypothetical protein [Paracidovorax citrulli]UMT89757.1 hypothetical protein FRC90_17915 [Paracidovorax citrulli]WIY35464.1 hypothetical protein QRO11_03740 [Paracidovorax citrulli]SDJ08268.1 hypothetical protein SAMN04489709_101183 [Paracidovorax citrulli]
MRPRQRTQAAPLPAADLERVVLDREHEHQGKKEPPGTELLVHPETARWLRAAGVITTLKD